MPTPLLKKYAEESGKTMDEAEICWAKAKHEADSKFHGEHDGHYWAYVNTSTRMCLGLPKHPPKTEPKHPDKKDHKKKH